MIDRIPQSELLREEKWKMIIKIPRNWSAHALTAYLGATINMKTSGIRIWPTGDNLAK